MPLTFTPSYSTILFSFLNLKLNHLMGSFLTNFNFKHTTPMAKCHTKGGLIKINIYHTYNKYIFKYLFFKSKN